VNTLPHADDARRAAESAARTSYGRLVAILAARTRDIAAAEDALADAFATALATWPERGVPAQPEAWLLTAARRNLHHAHRHARVTTDAVGELLVRLEERMAHEGFDGIDERLRLLFACAHPAITESIRTPLMLQTVLGLDAERIGSAFLVAPSTMGQRLVRAKAKIKEAGVPFEVPGERDLPERLEHVLRAIYVAFGVGWDDLDAGPGLAEEAIDLGRTLVASMPAEPEPKGLLALMLHCEARRAARRDAQGRFVPLRDQDPRRWTSALVVEAENLLVDAARAARFGRFQCEAAIQSVHAQRALTGVLHHDALRTLYDLLLAREPSIGVAVARAAALLEGGDLTGAEHALAALEGEDVARYQPYWVTRARLAELTGDRAGRRSALERALGLTESPAVRSFLSDALAEAREP
jgi:RNA polymerase sigma-70 factor (ECF subfamily)